MKEYTVAKSPTCKWHMVFMDKPGSKRELVAGFDTPEYAIAYAKVSRQAQTPTP